MAVIRLIGMLCTVSRAVGFQAALARASNKLGNGCREEICDDFPKTQVPLQRGGSPPFSSRLLHRGLLLKVFQSSNEEPGSKVAPNRRGRRRRTGIIVDVSDGENMLAHSTAATMLALYGRLFGQSANLFQVGALFGTIPTLLAGLVCSYWAWQVSTIHNWANSAAVPFRYPCVICRALTLYLRKCVMRATYFYKTIKTFVLIFDQLIFYFSHKVMSKIQPLVTT